MVTLFLRFSCPLQSVSYNVHDVHMRSTCTVGTQNIDVDHPQVSVERGKIGVGQQTLPLLVLR